MTDEDKYDMNMPRDFNIQNFGWIVTENSSNIWNNTQKSEQTYKSNFDKRCRNPQTWKPLTRLFLYQGKWIPQIWWFRLIFRLLLLFFTITIFKYWSDYRRGAEIIKKLHIISLSCHEVWHVLFRLFDFTDNHILEYLWWFLNQIIVPLICCIILLVKKRDIFRSSVCLWWAFESMIDWVSYIADANVMALPLITWGIGLDHPYWWHDWNYILTERGVLDKANDIALSVEEIALFWLCVSIIRGARYLYYSKNYSSVSYDWEESEKEILSEQDIKEIEDQIMWRH